jgi:transcriptional regulator with XRE-family HTH domain
MTIKEYCKERGISLAEFARLHEVPPQSVTKWVNKDWRIFDGVIYSPRRELKV